MGHGRSWDLLTIEVNSAPAASQVAQPRIWTTPLLPPRNRASSRRGASVSDMISMERPTVGCHAPSPPSWRARVCVTAPRISPPITKTTPVVRTTGTALDSARADDVLAGLVEAEDRQQAVEERDDQRRAPHGVVPHLPERRARPHHDAGQEFLPVQPGAARRGRDRARPVGRAVAVRVLADTERLGVARVVRVRVLGGGVALRLALALTRVVRVAEVLRLVLLRVAGRLPPYGGCPCP